MEKIFLKPWKLLPSTPSRTPEFRSPPRRAILRLAGCCVAGMISSAWVSGQTHEKWEPYHISRDIPTSDLNAKKLFRSKTKAASLENHITNFYLYKNDSLIRPAGSVHDFFSAGCLCFQYHDTLLFSSGLGKSFGLGVGVKIFRDQFSSSLHANSGNALVFKMRRSDSLYMDDLTVKPLHQSLRLIHAPDAQTPILIGELNATYRSFFQRGKSGKVYARAYRVRILFKCKVTGIDSLKY
jgi:hypothetical protein